MLIYCATPARLVDRMHAVMDFVTQQGLGPFHPFQAFEYHRFEGGPIGRKKTMAFCCRAINICDEFWMFGVSEGTLTELCYVLKRNKNRKHPKPIRLFLDEFDPAWKTEYTKLKDQFGDPLTKLK